MQEIWRDIVGYEGLYKVSNLGRVKSLSRYKGGRSKTYKVEEIILKTQLSRDGYLYVQLHNKNDNKKPKHYKIHRLVAEAFISNPDNKPCINHIDCDRTNNKIDNLEWCTVLENNQYASKLGRKKWSTNQKQKLAKPVLAINIKTGNNKAFNSITEAAKQLNLHPSSISAVCKGKYSQTGGYKFQYILKTLSTEKS